MGTHTVLTEDDDKGTPFTKVVFDQDAPYIAPSCGGGYGLLLRATLSHQQTGKGRKSEIHRQRQEQNLNFWDTDHRINTDSISAPFILSYLQSFATSYIWFAHFSQNMLESIIKKKHGAFAQMLTTSCMPKLCPTSQTCSLSPKLLPPLEGSTENTSSHSRSF